MAVARFGWFFAGGLLFALSLGCARAPRHQPHFLPVVVSPIPLPPGFLAAPTPPDNPLTIPKIELGRHLFYDTRLSLNQTQSCASCHQQQHAFTDGRVHAIGSTGQEHYRNTMTLANVGYRRPLTWADPSVLTLEQQALVPLTNRAPVELGMDGHFDELLSRLRADAQTRSLFAAAFPGEQEPVTTPNVLRAIASFEREIISAGSPYDRMVRYGELDAMPPAARRGMALFFSSTLGCSGCHGGSDFNNPAKASVFQDNGTFDRERPASDHGLSDKTRDRRDAGKFRVPSLRNVAVTAPYMHDGSAASLSEVIDDYAAGGHAARVRGGKPARGVGVRPFRITADQKADLIAFLESLTDESLLTDARLSKPTMNDER